MLGFLMDVAQEIAGLSFARWLSQKLEKVKPASEAPKEQLPSEFERGKTLAEERLALAKARLH